MSQAGALSSGGSGGSPIEQIDADSGSATPVAGVINLLGDSNSDNVTEGVTTSASGNTVTVLLTNRIEGSNTTVGATTETVNSYNLPASAGSYQVFTQISGYESTGPGYAGITIQGCIGTDGAATSVIGVPTINYTTSASLGAIVAELSVSGNQLMVDVTGVAGLTIDWVALTHFTVAS